MLEWLCESYRQKKEVNIDDVFETAYANATKSKSTSPEMDRIVKVIKKAQTECIATVQQLANFLMTVLLKLKKTTCHKCSFHIGL